MDKVTLEAKSRKDTGKKAAKLLRAAGRIPAVVYNSEGKSTMVDVDSTEFNKVWRTITATTMLTLNVDGAAHNVFIKDVEYNIREDKVLHADFWEPAADKEIVLKMKLLYSGTPAGVLKKGRRKEGNQLDCISFWNGKCSSLYNPYFKWNKDSGACA